MDNFDEESTFEENIADTTPLADQLFEERETSEKIKIALKNKKSQPLFPRIDK